MNEILKFLNSLLTILSTILLKPFHKISEWWTNKKREKTAARFTFNCRHSDDIVEFMRELKKTLKTDSSRKTEKFIKDIGDDDEIEDEITDYESALINGKHGKAAKKFKKVFRSIQKNIKGDDWVDPALIPKQKETLQELIRYILQS